MTPEHKAAIAELRDAGYAVVIFTPDELGTVGKDELESHLAEEGNAHIDRFAEDDAVED